MDFENVPANALVVAFKTFVWQVTERIEDFDVSLKMLFCQNLLNMAHVVRHHYVEGVGRVNWHNTDLPRSSFQVILVEETLISATGNK